MKIHGILLCVAVTAILAMPVVAQQTPTAPATPELTEAPPIDGQPAPTTQGAGDQKGEGEQKGAGPTNPPGFFEQYGIPLLLGGALVLMFWMSSRGRKKQEQKRREMLNSLKKGDKVTSVGGIIGTISDMKDDEVTVKVDEANNIKIKFLRTAIRGVGEEGKQDPEARK